MQEIIIILSAGIVTGMTTIMCGFGGGFIVVPFVYHIVALNPGLSHYAMHIAVATSTAVMIVNSSYATFSQWRGGHLLKETVLPIIVFIAAGALGGALLSRYLTDNTVRLLFIVYMLATIVDCLFRRGFIDKADKRPLSARVSAWGGFIIGAIAALLGVGGSVMTVPLLRRHGYEMRYCVSAANPLSVPVAILGSVVYAITAYGQHPGPEYIGFINIKILVLLIITGFIGIYIAKKFIPRIRDRLHAKIYVFLLLVVLTAMVF
ncbi:sulfite exporter TauE/SafE family protein [Sodalis sp. RH21]|uniref:sulfite exporter TauE/SafE family protein n=1 Tax=unclassified Sodalis (in: enterobacteria) TaxID=2636512 RepID=UPI0039B6D837